MADLFRHVFLPHCLMRLEDGSYVVTNRRYKPVGMTTRSHVVYEEHEVRVRFKRLTKETARALDFAGGDSLAHIRLYDDTCIPTESDIHWAAYSKRLQQLAGLEIEAA